MALSSRGFAQTTIAGGDVSGQVWTQAGSPYNVTGNISVASGARLEIQAGVTVLFGSGVLLSTNGGTIVARGTASEPIVLTSPNATASQGWLGIRLNNYAGTDSSLFEHVVIERVWLDNAGTFLAPQGAITFNGYSRAKVFGCTFRYNNSRYASGVALINSPGIRVSHSQFYNNLSRLGATAVFSMSSGYTAHHLLVFNNKSNYGAFFVREGGTVTIAHCTVTRNISSFMGANHTHLNIQNCIYWDNVSETSFEGGALNFTVQNCVIQGYPQSSTLTVNWARNVSQIWDINPQFVRPTDYYGNTFFEMEHDWRLSKFSPVINIGAVNATTGAFNFDLEGNPKSPLGCDAYDVGAYEFQYEGMELLPQEITADQIWQDTVFFACPVNVRAPATVTILPGTRVFSLGINDLNVEGSLLALGTAQNDIQFSNLVTDRALSAGIFWKGITLAANSVGNRFEHCHFSSAEGASGGMFEIRSAAQAHFADCVFDYNAAERGGAAWVSAAAPVFERCLFLNDSARSGGAIYAELGAAPSFTECQFVGNHALERGGAVFALQSQPSFQNCLFERNDALLAGGAFAGQQAQALLVNSLFRHNLARLGGAALSWQSDQSRFFNNNFIQNQADSSGGAFQVLQAGPLVQNNIFWQNLAKAAPNDLLLDQAGASRWSNNFIDGGLAAQHLPSGAFAGTYEQNVAQGQVFLDFDQGFALFKDSPCVDAGTLSDIGSVWELDYLGAPRLAGPIDMGMLELPKRIEVCGTLRGDTIWNADTVVVGCPVVVKPGARLRIFPGTVVLLAPGAELDVQGSLMAQGTPTDSILFDELEPGQGHLGIRVESQEAHHFQYLRLANGRRPRGGAIEAVFAPSLSFAHCRFEGNQAQQTGGALFSLADSLALDTCGFFFNASQVDGGAVASSRGFLRATACEFFGNQAASGKGGALALNGAPATFEHCLFSNNIAFRGGALFVNQGSLRMSTSLAKHNSAGLHGGFLFMVDGTSYLRQNTLVANQAHLGGAVAAIDSRGIWQGNLLDQNQAFGLGQQLWFEGLAATDFSHNLISGGTTAMSGLADASLRFGPTNLADSARFVGQGHAAGWMGVSPVADWALTEDSPGINAAAWGLDLDSLPIDFLGAPRSIGTVNPCDIPDMGAFEFQQLAAGAVLGSPSADTTWAGHVKVFCDVLIPQGQVLTIEPGAFVEFYGPYSLEIQGQMLALGSPTDSIRFGSRPSNLPEDEGFVPWRGILFTGDADGSSRMEHCQVEHAQGIPAPLSLQGYGQLAVANSTFSGNRGQAAGAIAVEDGSLVLDQCQFLRNHGQDAGAIDLWQAELLARQTIFRENSGLLAGVLRARQAGADVFNCAFLGNQADSVATLSSVGTGQVRVMNNFFAPNASAAPVQVAISGAASVFGHNLLPGLPSQLRLEQDATAHHNLGQDPLLREGSDFAPRSDSPLIDGGWPLTPAEGLAFDLEGQTRFFNDTIDIGLVEYHNRPPGATQLLGASLAENLPVGTFIGLLLGQDIDLHDRLAFSLPVEHPANAAFSLRADSLFSNVVFDFEQQDQFSILVETRDDGSGNLARRDAFGVEVLDDNDPPTQLWASVGDFDEKLAPGQPVALLSTLDQDTWDAHAYQILGQWPFDGLEIEGQALRVLASADFELADSLWLWLATTDAQGASHSDTLVFRVNDLNDAPHDLGLLGRGFPENQPAGFFIGLLSVIDQDAGQEHRYELAGPGLEQDFLIRGDSLFTARAFDFEQQQQISIRLAAFDNGTPSLGLEQDFLLEVQDLNEVPGPIALSQNWVDANAPLGSLVGILAAQDPDFDQQHQFILLGGENDNELFSIQGNELRTNAIFSYSDRESFDLHIQVSDDGVPSLSTWQAFPIALLDLNHPPTDILLPHPQLAENLPAGSPIDTLRSADLNLGDLHFYELVPGQGDTHNAWFEISGDKLLASRPFNFEQTPELRLRVRTTDNGLPPNSFERELVVQVLDRNDPPVLAQPLADVAIGVDEPLDLTFAEAIFFDEDQDPLVFSLSLKNGLPVPSWLSFSPESRHLSGVSRVRGQVELLLVAHDPSLASAADTFTLRVGPVVGVEGPDDLRWDIFPNPSSGTVWLRDVSGQPIRSAQLFDGLGRPLELPALGPEGRLELGHLPAGTYWLRLSSASGTTTRAIVLSP